MSEFNCKKILFSSSATVYGPSNFSLLNEDSNINPINPYGKTKQAIENLLTDVFNSEPQKWGVINLRYFNPIGAHESGLIGEDPLGKPNNIFPIMAKVAVGQQKKLKVFGNDWATFDGTGIRDYIHVMDLAEGHISTLEFLINNEPQIVTLNLGTGGVIITAPGDNVDFVSRFFTPRATLLEDPVTGSAHCSLIPYWAKKLNKEKMQAKQMSQRGGELLCHNQGDRVLIGGKARTYLKGTFEIK